MSSVLKKYHKRKRKSRAANSNSLVVMSEQNRSKSAKGLMAHFFILNKSYRIAAMNKEAIGETEGNK